MAGPGILTGGALTEIFSQETHRPESRGVFSPNPGSTAKTAFNLKSYKKDAESRESLARLFVEVPDKDAFLKSVSKESQSLAMALISGSNSGGAGGTGFFDFLMTEANETFNEKTQIVDTLTDNYVVYFSGREPAMANYAGTLLNTYQDDQRVWFLRLYSEILRGTRLATRNLIARLRYDSFLVSGYLVSLSMWLDGDTHITASRFSFQMLIKRMQVMSPQLSHPTQLVSFANPTDIPADEIKKSEENLAYNSREGVTTPEVPPTATEAPAASDETNVVVAENVRETLREKGKSDAEIDICLVDSANMTVAPPIDPREQEVLQSLEGVDRIANMSVNPENSENDGLGGASNMTLMSEQTPEVIMSKPRVEDEFDTHEEQWTRDEEPRLVASLQRTSGQRRRQVS